MSVNGDMHLSHAGAQFIARFEGFRAQPYNDPDTPPNATIGYGHMIHRGPVTAADRARYGAGLSTEAALELLQKDAAGFAASVRELVKVKLNQAQFDALVDFTYNEGAGGLGSSTLLREINTPGVVANLHAKDDGTRHAAQDMIRSAFAMWDRGSSGVLPGLQKRRAAESHLFMTGDYGS